MSSSNVAFNVTARDTSWSFPSDIPAPSRDDLDASLNVLTRRLEALRVFAGDAIAAPITGDLDLVRADISNLRNAHHALARDIKRAINELSVLRTSDGTETVQTAFRAAVLLSRRIVALEEQLDEVRAERDRLKTRVADEAARAAGSLATIHSLQEDLNRWVSRGRISRRTADTALARAWKAAEEEYGARRPAVVDGVSR